MKPLTNKVLLIGWDAADWKVMTPLLDEGKMPNLKKFLEDGVMGNLATLYPILSPMLWTSIATGKRAYKHGVHGFIEPNAENGTVRPITQLTRKTKAIWNILNQQGKRCNIIGWWPSYPVEPINGVMVSNHFQDAPRNLSKKWPLRPGDVHPPFFFINEEALNLNFGLNFYFCFLPFAFLLCPKGRVHKSKVRSQKSKVLPLPKEKRIQEMIVFYLFSS